MNFLLAEILAGLIMILQMESIKLWVLGGNKFGFYFGMAWTFVIFVLLWIMFRFNHKIIEGVEEVTK